MLTIASVRVRLTFVAVRRAPGGSCPWPVVGFLIGADAMGISFAPLVGTLAHRLERDFGVGSSYVGVTVAIFFLTGSVVAAVVGPHIDRVGPRRVVLACGSTTTAVLAITAAWGNDPRLVAVMAGLAGGSFALTLPATNALMATATPEHLHIFLVCCKQAAVPVAVVCTAGLAASIPGEWAARAAFGVIAVAALAVTGAVAIAVARLSDGCGRNGSMIPPTAVGEQRTSVGMIGLVTGLASLLPGTLAGYAPSALFSAGASRSAAAFVIGVGNLLGIAVRVASGAVIGRRKATWAPVAAMMLLGACGSFMVTTGGMALVTTGVILAFALGWGWSGLTYALVLVSNRSRAGATGAMLQAGGMFGTGIGPLIAAGAAHLEGARAGWYVSGLAIGAAGLIVVRLARNGDFRRDLP